MQIYSLRIDGAKVRNADSYHKAIRVSSEYCPNPENRQESQTGGQRKNR